MGRLHMLHLHNLTVLLQCNPAMPYIVCSNSGHPKCDPRTFAGSAPEVSSSGTAAAKPARAAVCSGVKPPEPSCTHNKSFDEYCYGTMRKGLHKTVAEEPHHKTTSTQFASSNGDTLALLGCAPWASSRVTSLGLRSSMATCCCAKDSMFVICQHASVM